MNKLLVFLVMLAAINANAQWEPDVRLTYASGGSYTSSNNTWCIAANGNVVHTIWYDDRQGFPNYEIYYKRSTDGGVNWGTDTRLTNSSAFSVSSSIAVSGSNVHVVWNEERDGNKEIYYKRSADGGINWGTDTRLTNDTAASELPSIAVSGSNVHIAWEDTRDGNYEIYYKRSTDGGINWGADTRLTNNSAESEFPSIAVSGSLVHVVWRDNRDSNSEIYYKCSTDSGISWGVDTRLTNNTGLSLSPSIAVSGSNVHIVWEDTRDGNYEIYYKRSTDSGVNWGTDTRLTYNTENSMAPSIVVSGTHVHFVWYDARAGNDEIYYKISIDGGTNWGADTRLTNNNNASWLSSIAVSGSLVHVVWRDDRDGNFEIYYKRNPTGNVGIQNLSTEIPIKYSLSQNYPNPFNPRTNIKFSIIKTEHVKLIVYDVMGREVKTLVNDRLQPGTYEASFDGSMLNSEVYFYKLITNGFTATKKMILIK